MLNRHERLNLETLYGVAGMIALVGDADVCDIWLLGRKVMPVGALCQVLACFHCLAGLLSSYSVKESDT